MEILALNISNWIGIVLGAAMLIAAAILIHRNEKLSDFLIVMGLLNLPAARMVGMCLMLLAVRIPARYDLYVNRFDGLIGFPANRAGELLASHPWLRSICLWDYRLYALPIVAAILYVAIHDADKGYRALASSFLAGVVAIPLFMLFPVCGPLYALPNFPEVYRGPAYAQSLHVVPNCVPSVHLTVALLVLWFLRSSKLGRVLASIHVGVTILATLGLGLHYAFDLIVAVPYAAAIIALPEAVARLRAFLKSPRGIPVPVESGD